MTKFNPNNFEKAVIYFEEKEVHLADGKVLPINSMLTKRGTQTEDWREALFIQAGKDDVWVNLRLLDQMVDGKSDHLEEGDSLI